MNKIPVVATIRAAYGFTFEHLGAIIGAIWLPMVIVSVTGFFAIQNFFGAMIDMLSGSNPAALGPGLLMMLAYLVGSLLLYAMMYTAVTQLALGTRQGGAMVYFAFGAVEWRVFRALLALAGVFFLLIMAAMLVVFVAVFAASASGAHLTPAQNSLLFSAMVYLVLAVGVVCFFIPLPAIAVAEDGPVLRRAWELSAGNFLRLLVIAIAVFGPGLAVMQVADALLTAAGSGAAAAGEQAQTIAAFQRERAAMPLVSGIAFLVSPLTLGLVAGASASAWRSMTQAAPHASRQS